MLFLASCQSLAQPLPPPDAATRPAAAPATLPVGSPGVVVAATVYQGSALVTREIEVKGGPGLVEIVVPGLPPQTLDSSLYTEGTKEIRVLSTRYRTRAIKEDIREEVRAKEEQIRQLRQKSDELQKSIEVQGQDTQLLAKLETFTGATMKELMEKGMLNPDSTMKLAQFIMEQRAAKAKAQVEMQAQV